MTISKQVTIGFSAIILLALMTVLIAFVVRTNSLESAETARALSQQAQTVLLPLERQARIAQFDVIQVQQFLSDASATHHQDSFTDAAKYAKDFPERVRAIQALLASSEARLALGEELNKLKTALDEGDKLFSDYNKLGIDMANTYISSGVDAGNVLMEKFDPMSDRICDAMQTLVDGASAANDRGAANVVDRMIGVQSSTRTGSFWILVINAGLFAVSIGIAVQLVINSMPRLTAMAEMMRRLADHQDLLAEIPGSGRHDEIGSMAEAVSVFRDGMIRADRLAEDQKQQQEIKIVRSKTIDGLIGAFDQQISTTVAAVGSAATKMNASAASLIKISETTTSQSATGASASNEVSVSIHTIAAATEELSSSISEISRQISLSSQIASKASVDAKRTDATVQSLAEATHKIGDVIGLINEIASQTNLLALNATIEAARAGDAGKGFAVVAGEVKSLANQTAKATEEITAQIAAIQASTDEAVKAIQGVGGTIREIDHITATIASAVEEQGAATQEISRNIQQAASGSDEVSRMITGITKAAEITHDSATDVKRIADELVSQGEQLRVGVGQFLTQVRAA